MGCPHCSFSEKLLVGVCPQCGYQAPQQNMPSTAFTTSSSHSDALPSRAFVQPLSSGDVLRGRRYRLLKQLNTPLQGQKATWLASDAQSASRRVILRQIAFPQGTPSDRKKMIQTITQGLIELAQHSGFPPVTDVFQDRGEYYIVQLYPEGESLASLLQQQGGTLPEREVAEYGLQICTMLSLLAQSHLSLIHGSISPETVIINSEKRQISLLYFPFSSSHVPQQQKVPTDYVAPEQIYGESSLSSVLYSLAATIHHALTGYNPHEHLAFFYPPARSLNPVVTPQMEALLTRALRPSASQRFIDPSQMKQEFLNLIASYSASSATSHSTLLSSMTGKAQIHQRNHQESLPNCGIAVGLGAAILLLFLTLAFYPLVIRNRPPIADGVAQHRLYQKALEKELHLESQIYRTRGGIGLSDGRFAFDVYAGRTQKDISLKQDAATSLQQGNLSRAVDDLTQATTADPADGEVQIYNEDLHISQRDTHYVTIVLMLSIDNNPSNLVRARADLESAFLAQHEINTNGLLPSGWQLRLLIDNSGGIRANMATVAQLIANRVTKAGNLDQIVAVVGWPLSSQSVETRDLLAATHLPLLSQADSGVALSGNSPYFFQLNPSDGQQGNFLGSIAAQQLHAKNVLVMQDANDPSSVSLANAFKAYLKANHITVIDDSANFREQTTTVTQYEQTVIQDATTRHADLIFLAGTDVDGIRLAHALGEISRANPTNTLLAKLKILGGNGLDSNLLLGLGESPDEILAANFPQDMHRLIFAGFAHQDEWTFLNIPQKQQPTFSADWLNTYQNPPPLAEGAPAPRGDAILTYDAIQLIARAATLASDSLTLHDALASLGHDDISGHDDIPAFQGVSGQIAFDAQGNPIGKALVLLDVEKVNGQNAIVLKQIAGKFI